MPMYGTVVTTSRLGQLGRHTPYIQQPLLEEEDDRQSDDARSGRDRLSTPASIDQYTEVAHPDWSRWLYPGTNDWKLSDRVGISPNNTLVQWFDGILVLALFLTATVTVFIVCVLMTRPVGRDGKSEEPESFSKLSFRLLYDFSMDIIFLADFILGFFRAYRKDGGRGRMVYDLREIRRLYVSKPGFAIDMVTSIPYDLLVFVGASLGFVPHNLRFLRLVRLFRIHRAYRIVNESVWYRKFCLRVDSRKLHMAQLVFGLIMVEHWASCWWVWMGREEFLLEKNRYTWIDRLEENGFIFNRHSELELYIVGLYWASTVSSSVGSGDIVPGNPQEAIFVAGFQILGGCLFAYAVSSLVGLYAALHATEEGRGAAIDAVNEMLFDLTRESNDVDVEKIRTFVWQAADARAARARRRLMPGGALAQLSPQLRDEIFLAERQPWMNKIWFLRKCRPRLARALARDAKWVTYAPGDLVTLTADQAIVITRGIATTSNTVLVRGTPIGLEGLATAVNSNVKKGPPMLCLNFVEGLMLDSASVEKAIRNEGDPWEVKRWLRARVRYGLLRWARQQLSERAKQQSASSQEASTLNDL